VHHSDAESARRTERKHTEPNLYVLPLKKDLKKGGNSRSLAGNSQEICQKWIFH
jgi:hypothetical protein